MPDHSTWLTLILAYSKETLEHNASLLGSTVLDHNEPTWQSWEPLAASSLIMLLVLFFASAVRDRIQEDDALIPEERLSLRTFAEIFRRSSKASRA